MSQIQDKMQALASASGLKYDPTTGLLYGTYNGFTVCIRRTQNNRMYLLSFHVTRNGEQAELNDWKELAKESGGLLTFNTFIANVSTYSIKLGTKDEEMTENLRNVLNHVTERLNELGFRNTCERCREEKETCLCTFGEAIRFLCDDCYSISSEDVNEQALAYEEKHENVPARIVGAIGGALIGAIVVVLLGQLNRVSAISGLIAAVCSIKGYELLAKKLSIKGVIISCVAMLVMIYVAHRVDWAIAAAKFFEVDFFTAFRAIPDLIKEGAIELKDYLLGFGQTLLFAALGAVPTVIVSMKGQKKKFQTAKLS